MSYFAKSYLCYFPRVTHKKIYANIFLLMARKQYINGNAKLRERYAILSFPTLLRRRLPVYAIFRRGDKLKFIFLISHSQFVSLMSYSLSGNVFPRYGDKRTYASQHFSRIRLSFSCDTLSYIITAICALPRLQQNILLALRS